MPEMAVLKKKAIISEKSKIIARNLLKEHRWQGILVLLRKFCFHAINSSFEEEGNQMLVRSLRANLLEGRDVGRTVFKANDEQGVIGSEENEVREQAASSTVLA